MFGIKFTNQIGHSVSSNMILVYTYSQALFDRRNILDYNYRVHYHIYKQGGRNDSIDFFSLFFRVRPLPPFFLEKEELSMFTCLLKKIVSTNFKPTGKLFYNIVE